MENELILDLLLCQVGNANGLQVSLEGSVRLAFLEMSVANFNVSLKPGVLKLEHLFEGRDGGAHISHLTADLCQAAQVVEVLFIFNS